MHIAPLLDTGITPLLVQPAGRPPASPRGLAGWVSGHRQDLDDWLHRHGAVLLRGFGIGTPAEFHDVVSSYRPRLLNYVGGDSPRRGVVDQVYTSTEFPPHLEIGLHNELSYTRSWPQRLFFCALAVAQSGGETHLADGRKVLDALAPEVHDRFARKDVLYLQHLRDQRESGTGKSWQETFETSDRAAVEQICTVQDMEFEWTGRGLRTSLCNPGLVAHRITGETCWFNQADLWHREFDTVKGREQPDAPEASDDQALGCHASFGDGSEIPPSDLQSIRDAYQASEITFPWQPGDLLILDNVLTLHGRKPFTGERRVLVAMA